MPIIRGVSRYAAAIVLLVGLCLASAPAAGASTWRTATPGRAPGGLLAVSCVSPQFCMAVGSVHRGTRGVTLAETYDGTVWTVMPTPDVAGATDNELLGVSCSSLTACTAVGFSQNRRGATRTLAERWNGAAWSIQPTPFVLRSGLAAVSCPSAAACTAVGGAGSFPNVTGSALAERWNGARWSVQRIPRTAHATAEGLRGVWCASASACTAVGEESDGGPFYGVALAWKAGKWSTQLRYGNGFNDYVFNAVWCGSPARHCIAVGQSVVSPTISYGLWARRTGGKWSEPRSNIVADNQELDGLGCVSARACIAVGAIHVANAYAETWNGSSWSFDQVSGSHHLGLAAVSCWSRTGCAAVGVFERQGKPSYPAVAVRRR